MPTSYRASGGSGGPRVGRSGWWRLGAVLAGLLVVAGPVATVSAHATFVSMSPDEGSLVTTAPTEVVVTFNQPIKDIGTSFVVTAPSGASVASGSPVVTGSKVTQALLPLVEQGTYAVAYRVTSTDGHPVSRGLTFAYGSRSAVAPAASATPSQSSGSPVVMGAAVVGVAVVGLVGFQLVRRRAAPGTRPASGGEHSPEDPL